MGIQQAIWRTGKAVGTGWETLSIPARGTFMRDWQDRYYYLQNGWPVTWQQIGDPEQVAVLKRNFSHAYGY
jgi:hypothetical protein